MSATEPITFVWNNQLSSSLLGKSWPSAVNGEEPLHKVVLFDIAPRMAEEEEDFDDDDLDDEDFDDDDLDDEDFDDEDFDDEDFDDEDFDDDDLDDEETESSLFGVTWMQAEPVAAPSKTPVFF